MAVLGKALWGNLFKRPRIILLIIVMGIVGCFGRPRVSSIQSVDFNQFHLTPQKPAVIVFSALWCHPCREEILTLNLAKSDFNKQLQFVGFLVEGAEKGSSVTIGDAQLFTAFNGEAPTYPIQTDEHWQKFDSLHPPQGRALPLMVLVNEKGQIVQMMQQDLDYESQLKPLLEALSRGETIAPNPGPTPEPTPVLNQIQSSVADWLKRPEVAANLKLIENVRSAWSRGLEKYDFSPTDMPFEGGQITFTTDAKTKADPNFATWYEESATSICKLRVSFAPNGVFQSATGSCKPK